MQLNKKSKIFCKTVSILLIFCLTFGSNGNASLKQAFAANLWLKIVGGSNGVQDDAKVDKYAITQTGTHNSAKDGVVRYKTLYFYMTKNTYDLDTYFTQGSNAVIEKQKVPYTYGTIYDDGTTKTVQYIISMKDFISAAAELGVTGDYIIEHGSTTVYTNNVFMTYLNDSTRDDYVYGYQEMLDAEGWSAATVKNLKGYYNYKYTITNGAVFNVKVIAVDTENNVLDNDLLGYTKHAIYAETIPPYTLPSSKETITKNSITYKYQNYWEYTYQDRTSGEIKTIKNQAGKNVSFKAPDVAPGTDLTIRMVYEPQKIKYNYKIVMVDGSHNYLQDILSGPIATYSGATVSFSSTADRVYNKKTYKYQYKWYLTYTDSNGNKIVGNEQTGKLTQSPMPTAKENSTAVFSMVYSTAAVTPIPEATATPTPSVTATPTPTPSAAPTQAPILPDAASLDFTTVVNTGKINPDVRYSERFTATRGVPTIESLYGEVTAKDYLLGYSFVKKTGEKYYSIKVTKNYVLSWKTATPASKGKVVTVTQTVPVSQYVTVKRVYGYWEIENLECYKISKAVLNNYALPDGSITLYPNYSYYNPPSVTVQHSGLESYHVMPPSEVTNGISLGSESVSSSGTSKPTIPNEDFTNVALNQTGNIQVRNDTLIFNGTTVMNGQLTETDTPNINTSAIPQCDTFINENVLYIPDNIIAATKINGTYASTGTITYTAVATVNPIRTSTPEYSIDGINKVVIHTPVVCNPSITADNDKYVQLINPTEGCTQLVLDPDPKLSDFTVTISNYGPHSNKQGYYTRDFSKALRDPDISYILKTDGLLKNQVKFPFNVYIDKDVANNCSDDELIKSETWITIGRSSPRFYLPMTVSEGVYTVNFRTIAVNGEPYINRTEHYANTDLGNYVATNTLKVEVSGRIYGLTIYDISDYPLWEEVFRVPNSLDFKKDFSKYTVGTTMAAYSKGRSYTYTIGTNDPYGNDTGRNNKYTFPLVNGSHPKYKNIGILKTGYIFRYFLDTTGNLFSDACRISIKPNFYFVDQEGKNRTAVDLYYKESINNKTRRLVKVGGALDKTNLKTYTTGDLYLGIPQAELKQTAVLRGMTYSKLIAKSSVMFNYSEIRLNWAFRTYVNNAYAAKIKTYASYSNLLAAGTTQADILERMQRWYGQYYIPNEVHAVAKGFDVMDYADKYGIDYDESFWLKDGYIIVNFTIETVSEDGTHRLSYINSANYKNNGNCSMWITEGPITSKTSYKGPTFSFFAGDVLIYYANQKLSDDYQAGAIY